MPDFEVTAALLNRRSGPSMDDPVVEVLPRGRMITGSIQGAWVRTVTSDGATYAMARYLRELTVARAEATGVVFEDLTAGAAANVPISFPAGRFQTAPTVMATQANESHPQLAAISVTPASASGGVIRMTRAEDGRTRVNWHAVEGAS